MAKRKSLLESLSDELILHRRFAAAVTELVIEGDGVTVSAARLAYLMGILDGKLEDK
jgi:hypothetical protein